MATELGKAYVQIIPSAEGIKNQMIKELGGDVVGAGEQTGKSFGSKLVSFATKAIAAGGIGKAISSSISEGADLQQSVGGIETLFKSSADKVQEYASQAYKTVGLSANAYMENVTGFSASLLQSLGGDTAKAADIANMAMIDMADNSNKMGTAMESIQVAYQGFAKQNYTMLDNLKLGYGGTKKEMERLLADAEKLTGVKYDINNLSDVYEAIHAVQQELGITGTTAKEAGETLTGSLHAMQASFKDVLGAIATGLDWDFAFQGFTESIITFSKNLFPMLNDVLTGLLQMLIVAIKDIGPPILESFLQLISDVVMTIGGRFPDLAKMLTTALLNLAKTVVDNLPTFIDAGLKLIEGLGQGLTEALPILLENLPQIIDGIVKVLVDAIPLIIETGVKLLTALVENMDKIIQMIVDALPKIIDGIVSALLNNIDKIIDAGVQLLTALITNLPQIIITITTAMPKIIMAIVKGFIDAIPKIIETGVKLFTSLIQNLPQIISAIVEAVPKIIKSVLDKFRGFISDFVQMGKNLIMGLGEGIKKAAGAVVDAAAGVANWAVGGIKRILKIASPSKLTMEYGRYIDEGLAEGISGNVHYIDKAMQDIENSVVRPLSSNLDYTLGMPTQNLVMTTKENDSIKKVITLLDELVKKEIILNVDGKEVARTTAPYMSKELALEVLR